MTATTVPWPQVGGNERGVVRVSNLAYSLVLPVVMIYSVFIIVRRRASTRLSGEAVMLLQLSCAMVVAVIFFGDPRVRSTYDVFGLALLAACLVDAFKLNEGRTPSWAGPLAAGSF